MGSEASRSHEFVDTVHRVLSNRRRRRIVTYLDEAETATVDELVDWLVDDGPEGDAPDRGRVEIGLQHNHLPLLAEAGAVKYDGDRVTLTSRGRTTAEIRRIIDRHLDERRPRRE